MSEQRDRSPFGALLFWSALYKSADLVEKQRQTKGLKRQQQRKKQLTHRCTNTHIVSVQKHILNGKSHLRTDHQSHTQTLKFILHCQRVSGVATVPAKRSIAVFPHDLSIPFFFFPFLLTVNCMCFECVFAGVHWPLHPGGELLNSSPLHRSQFSLALGFE